MATPSNSNQRKFVDQKGALQLLSVKNQLPEGQNKKAGKLGSNTKGCFNCGLTTCKPWTGYSEVMVDRIKMTALIDTGSPVTLMSPKQAVQMLALKKGDFSSIQEWKETMMDWFHTLTVMLKSYSGDRLKIVAQLPWHRETTRFHPWC